MAQRLKHGSVRRRIGWVLIVLGVALAHGLVMRELAQSRAGWGAADEAPRRLEVAFVRELVPAAPPRKPPKPKPKAKAKAPEAAVQAPVPEPIASAPQPAPEPEVIVQAPTPPAEAASEPEPAASEPAPPPFEWPPSTRLRYALQGNYRGEIHGGAQVQWIRVDQRYQVHVDVWLGPPFAPFFERRMTSDGELTEAGLEPRRYDEENKVAFRAPRRATMRFEPDRVVMPNGSLRDPLRGLQDTASQFVQLTWLFTTQPQLLRAGTSIAVPLALPRRVDRWVYDVIGEERLRTPVGELDTFHLKPRREAKRAGEMAIELWFAPSLQYLPVRIRIELDPETWADALLESRPTQTER